MPEYISVDADDYYVKTYTVLDAHVLPKCNKRHIFHTCLLNETESISQNVTKRRISVIKLLMKRLKKLRKHVLKEHELTLELLQISTIMGDTDRQVK